MYVCKKASFTMIYLYAYTFLSVLVDYLYCFMLPKSGFSCVIKQNLIDSWNPESLSALFLDFLCHAGLAPDNSISPNHRIIQISGW